MGISSRRIFGTFKGEDLNVSLSGNSLTINGSCEGGHWEHGAVTTAEAEPKAASRAASPSRTAPTRKLSTAGVRHGVLTVRLPKKLDAESKQIAIGKEIETQANA